MGRCFAHPAQQRAGQTVEAEVRVFTLRWIDAAAGLMWVICAGIALGVSLTDSQALRPWVVVMAAAGVVVTHIAWASRRLDQIEARVYAEGMQAGYDAQRIVRLHEHV